MKIESQELIKKHFCFDCNIADGKYIYVTQPEDDKVTICALYGYYMIYSSRKLYDQIKTKSFKNLEKLVEFVSKKFCGKETVEEKYYFADDQTKLTRRKSRMITIRSLTRTDGELVANLEKHCSSTDLDLGQVTLYDFSPIGAFIGEELVGIASLLDLNGIFDIGVIVDSRYRKKGIGRSLTYYLANQVVKKNKLVRYLSLTSNTASIKNALSINLEEVAILYNIYK